MGNSVAERIRAEKPDIRQISLVEAVARTIVAIDSELSFAKDAGYRNKLVMSAYSLQNLLEYMRMEKFNLPVK